MHDEVGSPKVIFAINRAGAAVVGVQSGLRCGLGPRGSASYRYPSIARAVPPCPVQEVGSEPTGHRQDEPRESKEKLDGSL